MKIMIIQLLISSVLFITFIIYTVFNRPYDWNKPTPLTFVEALYITLSNVSTIGYGQYYPTSDRARYVGMVLQIGTILGLSQIFEIKGS